MGRRSWVVAAAGGVAAVAVAGAAWGGGGSKDYPGALPGAKTNVSSGRTLADHGVSLPPGYSGCQGSVDAMDAMVADAGHGVCRVYLLSGEAMGPSDSDAGLT